MGAPQKGHWKVGEPVTRTRVTSLRRRVRAVATDAWRIRAAVGGRRALLTDLRAGTDGRWLADLRRRRVCVVARPAETATAIVARRAAIAVGLARLERPEAALVLRHALVRQIER